MTGSGVGGRTGRMSLFVLHQKSPCASGGSGGAGVWSPPRWMPASPLPDTISGAPPSDWADSGVGLLRPVLSARTHRAGGRHQSPTRKSLFVVRTAKRVSPRRRPVAGLSRCSCTSALRVAAVPCFAVRKPLIPFESCNPGTVHACCCCDTAEQGDSS